MVIDQVGFGIELGGRQGCEKLPFRRGRVGVLSASLEIKLIKLDDNLRTGVLVRRGCFGIAPAI